MYDTNGKHDTSLARMKQGISLELTAYRRKRIKQPWNQSGMNRKMACIFGKRGTRLAKNQSIWCEGMKHEARIISLN